MKTRLRMLLIVAVLMGGLILSEGCQFSHEKQKELNQLDSLSRDSTRKAYNPYKAGQGTQVYDQQREALGNLDSLVTP